MGAHTELAETLMAAGRYSDAVAHWDKVLQLSSQPVGSTVRLSRARALARTERVAEGLTEAVGLLSEPMRDELRRYNVACVYAQAAASGSPDADQFARRGVLLVGYEGMKQREANIPQEGMARLTEALERLAQLYDSWGKKDKADEWRKRWEAAKTRPQPPAKP